MANEKLKITQPKPKGVQGLEDWVAGKPVDDQVNTNAGGLVARFVKFWSENYPEFFKDETALKQKPFPKGN